MKNPNLGASPLRHKIQIVKSRGFTILELIIAIAIIGFMLTVAVSIVNFQSSGKRSSLDSAAQELAEVLRLAQNKTLASENISQYGVYLDDSQSDHRYILFKGSSFDNRDVSFDQPYVIASTLELANISFGGGREIVFNRLTGKPQISGSLALRLKSDTSQTRNVYLSSSGTVSFYQPVSGSDSARVKDSRHVHFDYSRAIDSASESVVLTFDNSVTQTIAISSYLLAGKFDWSGKVSVAGTDQTVRIHSHRLNSPDTQFSVERDRSLNSKSLKITISGDSSGSLAEYTADGLTTSYASIYVSNFNWQ